MVEIIPKSDMNLNKTSKVKIVGSKVDETQTQLSILHLSDFHFKAAELGEKANQDMVTRSMLNKIEQLITEEQKVF